MKIETRNQLIGVLIGAAGGAGIVALPGVQGIGKAWVVIAAAASAAGLLRHLRRKYKGRIPGLI
jgi:hypothetical protein